MIRATGNRSLQANSLFWFGGVCELLGETEQARDYFQQSLARNENYFKTGKPHLDRVIFKVMPSTANAAIAFENGEADFLMNAAPLDVARLRQRPGIVITDKGREAYATVETMVPNLTRAPLSDLRVRQAIAHAIDRQFIVDKIHFGQARAATGPVSSLLAWAYNPNVTKYDRDIALANRLLDEAGYKRRSHNEGGWFKHE